MPKASSNPLVQLEIPTRHYAQGLVGNRAGMCEITKSAGRHADVANRLTDPLHEIANRGGVRDDAGPAVLQWNRTTLENVDIPSLVPENQRCGQAPEGSPHHECPGHGQVPSSRILEHVHASAREGLQRVRGHHLRPGTRSDRRHAAPAYASQKGAWRP